MLQSDLVHFIGSDAHGVTRSEMAYQADLKHVKEIVGEKTFQDMTLIQPEKLLAGKSIQSDKEYFLKAPMSKKKKSGLWGLLARSL